ncbi:MULTISPECIES: TetR/AcrR family transcriptional regulator [Thermomonosporaceae]|uniref:TetR/AcrR family transcriptional regulator n=1 Tax=Thermomonosporaceae TaxID=2012 RepID=UPI00255A845A|nr:MULTISPECIES: TetR/AcrR family transcriptional regulator [Thermomonosporaceae]MDL4773062.1 TetR/AcrR family transcriptional regulator [Actinomadura xylanilytica]
MQDAEPATGAGRRAQANRQRILATATEELIREPDASMDDIARAAGVVRRTLYGHFPSRDALIAGIAGQALAEMTETFEREAGRPGSPAETLARFFLALWQVGDRYRLLISLGERSLPGSGISGLLAPVRDRVAVLLAEGQRDGDFARHLPAPVLAQALEGLTLALLRAVNEEVWREESPAAGAARACLIAAGVESGPAAAIVAGLTGALAPSDP